MCMCASCVCACECISCYRLCVEWWNRLLAVSSVAFLICNHKYSTKICMVHITNKIHFVLNWLVIMLTIKAMSVLTFKQLTCKLGSYWTENKAYTSKWCEEKIKIKQKKKLAEDGFDPSTSGLWAQHAPTAPLCYHIYNLDNSWR